METQLPKSTSNILNIISMVNFHRYSFIAGRFESIFTQDIFKLILVINGLDISWDITIRWMSLGLTDDR